MNLCPKVQLFEKQMHFIELVQALNYAFAYSYYFYAFNLQHSHLALRHEVGTIGRKLSLYVKQHK